MISPTDLKFLHWYNDAGHGWLGVPMRMLVASGVAGSISQFSYVSNAEKVAYLEEDCDAPRFLRAIGMSFESAAGIPETTYDGHCFVRRMASYARPAA